MLLYNSLLYNAAVLNNGKKAVDCFHPWLAFTFLKSLVLDLWGEDSQCILLMFTWSITYFWGEPALSNQAGSSLD